MPATFWPIPLWHKPKDDNKITDNARAISKSSIPRLPGIDTSDTSRQGTGSLCTRNVKTGSTNLLMKRSSSNPPLRRSSSSPCLIKTNEMHTLGLPDNYKLGEIPKYLQCRKKQWKEEAERKLRDAPDPNVPPGHELLPECERLQTLEQLKLKHDELLKQEVLLPVCINTLRTLKKKEAIDKEIARVEEALKIFSHPKVYIKTDA